MLKPAESRPKTPIHHELRHPVTLEWLTGQNRQIRLFQSSFWLFRTLQDIAQYGGKVEHLAESLGCNKYRVLTKQSRTALNLYLVGMKGFSSWKRANNGSSVYQTRHGWPMFCDHLELQWDTEK